MATKQFNLGNGFFLLIGTAARDAEPKFTPQGTKVCSFGLLIGKDDSKPQGQQGIFADVQAWRELADYAENIQKGDTIMAVGTVKSREYKGKTYKTLNAEFVSIAKWPAGHSDAEEPEAYQPPAVYGAPAGDFEDVDEDSGDLPF